MNDSICQTGPATDVSRLRADAVEASSSVVGIARHAVPPGGHLGVLLLEYIRHLRVSIYCGLQDRTGAHHKATSVPAETICVGDVAAKPVERAQSFSIRVTVPSPAQPPRTWMGSLLGSTVNNHCSRRKTGR